ncbi:MAG: ABC transporter permease [Solobacterium sp.]|nr:ABC transporter permease [Solobacterium sp.]MBR3347115.1 ABC transporter permease [Solobacterium sp.]
MNFFQRAIRYVKRKSAKSFLLAITFFVIGNLVILGLGVSQAADNAKILTRKKMRAVVSYEVDYEAWWDYADNIEDSEEREAAYRNGPVVQKEKALEIAKDERVLAFNYMVNDAVYGIDLEFVPLGNDAEKELTDSENTSVRQSFMVYANLQPEMLEMAEGTFTILEGSWYTQQDIDGARPVCCITKELADQNALHVGDTITITSVNQNNKQDYENAGYNIEDLNLELEVIGIYDTKENVDPNSENFKWMSSFESPKNRIMMPLTTYVEHKIAAGEMELTVHPSWYDPNYTIDDIRKGAETPNKVIYLLDDPLNVDKFVEDHSGSLGDFLRLNANNETFKKMARPLDSMSFFANIVVWIVVINAIIIISLVTALTLKTREYEIGVLLSMGVSKPIIVVQLFVELVLLAFLGFGLASVSGSIMAGNVGNLVLEYQTSSEAKYEDNDNDSYFFASSDSYFTEVSQDDMLSEYHVSVSPLLILEIFILGTGVVLIAIVIPSFMIMRLNPKQILLEQN